MTTPCRSAEVRFDAFLISAVGVGEGGTRVIKSTYRSFEACGLSPALIRHAAVCSRVQDESLVAWICTQTAKPDTLMVELPLLISVPGM